jgi:hypothetical protein
MRFNEMNSALYPSESRLSKDAAFSDDLNEYRFPRYRGISF